VKVTFNFGSSATLATQINEGAPADVFAAASPATMKTVTDAGNGEGGPVTFVRNKLEIAVPSGNPGKVEGLDDFAKDDLDIALCDSSVPCGAAADKVFTAAGITPKPDTRETDVKATLTKVELGEVDAALVYQTDVRASNKANPNKVEGINFPEADQAINDYQIVALKDSDVPDLAAEWVDYVSGSEAQGVLTAAGFQPGSGAAESPGTDPSTEPTDAAESPSPTSS
jgi:molybdate transport system substrate-binding protein